MHIQKNLINKINQSKLSRKIFLLPIALFLLIILGWAIYINLTKPVTITDLHFERSLSSRTTDAPIQKEFKVDDPVMMVVDYTSAQPHTSAKLEVYKGNTRVRSVDMPYLRGENTSPDAGRRYVSIVNGRATRLEIGEYNVKLIINSGRMVVDNKIIVK